jgi:hypothetical protein
MRVLCSIVRRFNEVSYSKKNCPGNHGACSRLKLLVVHTRLRCPMLDKVCPSHFACKVFFGGFSFLFRVLSSYFGMGVVIEEDGR